MIAEKKPELRFPEFKEEWNSSLIGETLSKVIDYRGKAPPKTDTGVFLITARNVRLGYIDFKSKEYIDSTLYSSWMNRGLPNPNDVCFTTEAPLGNVCLFPEHGKFALGQRIITLQTNMEILFSKFLFQFLLSPVGRKKVLIRGTGSTAKGIKSKEFVKIPISYGSIPEQKKIAEFLGAVDEKIRLLQSRYEQLTLFKKGAMQKIFAQDIRFKADDGSDFPDWEEKALNKVLFETKARNFDLLYNKEQVLSVSGEKGIVNQIGHLGRSYAGASVHNYHIVETGDIVYTKSPLKANPYGIIKCNFGTAGIVSTLYAVYRPFDPRSARYLDHYFSIDDNLNKYLRPLVRKGAKNDMKINNAYVLNDPICIPSPEEQEKIADFLSTIDEKIEAVAAQVENMQRFKKGLLQQMFV